MFPTLSLRSRHVAHVVGMLLPIICIAQQQPTFKKKKATPQLPSSGVSRVVITGDEIRRQNVRSLDDLLRGEAPDVFATGPATATTTTLRSRGLSSSTTWSTPRVYLNGVELDAPGSLREIAPEIVDSVVIRPGVIAGAFDGVGADGGVIYIYTQRGSDSTRVTSGGKITGGNDRSLYGQKTQRFHDDLVAFSGGREGATYYLAGGTTSEGAWAPGYQSKIRHGIASLSSTGSYGTLSGFYIRQRDAGTPDDQSPTLATTIVDTGLRTDTTQHTTYGGLADLNLTPFWTIHASGGVHRAEYGGSEQQMLATSFDSMDLHAHQTIRRTSYDARTTLRAPLSQSFTTLLTAGVNQAVTVDEYTFGQRLDTTLMSYSNSRIEQHRRGYFGLLGLRYNQLFVLNAGARRDDQLGVQGLTDSKWRPRADAALMMPTPFGRLTLRGGTGYIVVPTVTYITVAPNVSGPSGLVGLLSVRDLHAAEAGADLAGDVGALGVTVYDQRSNTGYAELQSSLGSSTPFSLGGAQNKGLAAYARGNYHEWSGRMSYSVVQARQDSVLAGISSPYAQPGALPEAFGHASITYTGESGRLSYDANYTASHHDIDVITPVAGGRTYPAFFLHDVNASAPFGKDAWIIAYVHNIANAEEYDMNNGTYVRGRRLGFGVRFGSE